MKKLLAMFLLAFVLILSACGGGELAEDKKIEEKVNEIVKEFSKTKAKQVRVHEDVDIGEGYKVVIELSLGEKKESKIVKETLEKFTSDLSVKTAETEGINEIKVIYEVPHLVEDDIIANGTIRRENGKMIIEDEWFDREVFD